MQLSFESKRLLGIMIMTEGGYDEKNMDPNDNCSPIANRMWRRERNKR